MRIGLLGCVLVSSIGLFACGGGGASGGGATSPSGSGSLAVTVKGEKHELSGPVLVLAMPKTKQLKVSVWDPSSEPLPTCANWQSAMGNMKKGTSAAFDVFEFDGKPGTYKLAGVGYMAVDQSKGNMTMSNGEAGASSLVVEKWEGKSFAGTVKTEGEAESGATGHVEGAICTVD